MTPEEALHRSFRVTNPAPESDEATSKDLLEETRLQAVAHLERYQRETKAWKDKRVKGRAFAEGNLVLRRRPNAETIGKFESKWEGPYIVVASNRPGSYRLMTEDGREDPHTWNADSLVRYYP